MSADEVKAALHAELQWARQAMVGKLVGLDEYDVRRPLTGTGTNLLGLVKHLAMGESMYFGVVFDRPFPEHLPWWDDSSEIKVDMWATAQESRAWVLDLYRRAGAHADATIEALELDTPGRVPWWPEPQIKLINAIAHVLAETNRHVGHADILREQLDGSIGDASASGLPGRDAEWWRGYVAIVEAEARAAIGTPDGRVPDQS